MNNPHGIRHIKVIALSVQDMDRANAFYGNTLGLELEEKGESESRWKLGSLVLLLKSGWMAPTAEPNPRLTVEVEDAYETEASLKEAGVTIADPVQLYGGKFRLGSFLDSEGNKFWICSQH